MCRSGCCFSRSMTKSMNRSKICFSSLTGKCPVSRVGGVAVAIREGIAEQIFEAAFASERIALQVEEDISGRGFRKSSQSESRHHRQKFVEHGSGCASLDLDARLLAHALVGLRGTACGLPCQGNGHRCEGRRGCDAVPFQLIDMNLCDPCHERKMVVGPPPLVAAILPTATSQCSFGSG